MYKQKLIDLLKSDEQTKTAMEKLEFWCKLIPINIPSWKNDNFRIIHYRWDCYGIVYKRYFEWWYCEDFIDSNIKEIIWLPLQERFLRMYCDNKNILIYIRCDWLLQIRQNWEYKDICKLDNTKDFDNQSEELYQKIYETLLQLN